MGRVCLISCVSEKVDGPVPAAELYVSPWFKKARAYAQNNADSWFILSAEHHLLDPTEICCRYEKTLIRMGVDARRQWAAHVTQQLLNRLAAADELIFLAGEDYREFLIPAVAKHGFKVRIPMEGRRVGEQLHWLDNPHAQDVERFYDLLDDLSHKLGGPRCLKNCQGSDGWPRRGVYFFFEPNEMRRFKRDRMRVVRIGTHAISSAGKSSLWTRLRTHRGTRSGGGNHRGSIYRRHAGAAIMRRDGLTDPHTWLQDKVTAADKLLESEMEQRVSKYLGTTSFLWLDVNDEPSAKSDRSFIEKNAIALLSRTEQIVDPPSPSWLGLHSDSVAIRTSGLWNVDHVGAQYDASFLEKMAERVAAVKPHSANSF